MVSSRRVGTNENISTFGASGQGRDYTTLSAWESATDYNLANDNVSEVLECYDDQDFNQTVTISGATTDTSYFRIIRPAAGQGHDGTPNTGVTFESTASSSVFVISEQNFHLQDLVVGLTVNSGSQHSCFDVTQANSHVVGCIGNDPTNSGGGHAPCVRTVTSVRHHYVDCLFINKSVEWQGQIYVTSGAPPNSCHLYNCTSRSNGIVSYRSGGVIRIRNWATYTDETDPNQIFRYCSSWDSDYCACNQAEGFGSHQLPGANNRWSQTYSFVDLVNDDLHLQVTDGAARDFGVDMSSDSSFAYDDDIDKEQFFFWDIGFDEPEPVTVFSGGWARINQGQGFL